MISKILANCLKLVIPSLIGSKQNGFLLGRGPIDNIIATQEIAHNLDSETQVPPRLLCKIDIEKSFDTVEWPAIIATFQRMCFLSICVKWV